MKKTLVTVAALMLTLTVGISCGIASGHHDNDQGDSQDSGWAKVSNIQGEYQNDVGVISNKGDFVGIAGGVQGQYGTGETSADKGTMASDIQINEQGNNKVITSADGDTVIRYPSYQGQIGSGTAEGTSINNGHSNNRGCSSHDTVIGGEYEYFGVQGQAAGAVLVNDGSGQAGAAGMGYVGGGINGASANEGGEATQAQVQRFDGSYDSLNVGDNSYTRTYGVQDVDLDQQVHVGGDGPGQGGGEASTYVGVVQGGGSFATNNGENIMVGGTTASAAGTVGADSSGRASAEASYDAKQTYGYNQGTGMGTDSWQSQSGSSTTIITGNADSGGHR